MSGIMVYCRACGELIADKVDLMGAGSFKVKHGTTCPNCKTKYSDYFNIKKEIKKNDKP